MPFTNRLTAGGFWDLGVGFRGRTDTATGKFFQEVCSHWVSASVHRPLEIHSLEVHAMKNDQGLEGEKIDNNLVKKKYAQSHFFQSNIFVN